MFIFRSFCVVISAYGNCDRAVFAVLVSMRGAVIWFKLYLNQHSVKIVNRCKTMSEKEPIKLYKCEPVFWKSMLSERGRAVFGWITVELFVLSFLSVPICALFALPIVWNNAQTVSIFGLTFTFLSMIWPMQEWPLVRKVGQLWYEIFQVSSNVSPDEFKLRTNRGDKEQFIMAMHPHGIVPLQAVLWAAYCDQYFNDPETGKSLYGFGAAADVVMYLPFLRNIMGWLSAGGADYKTLKRGLVDGICSMVNASGRRPRHLYILPGGVAEIFVSTPGKHAIVFKSRKGLCKLSIETGAKLTPCYVFGGTDFFHNLATSSGVLSSLSRYMKAGVTIFWGQFGLPVPFTPRVTFIIGEPIEVPDVGTWDRKTQPVPAELIDQLHETYMKAMVDLFNEHKAICGYPDAVLEVL